MLVLAASLPVLGIAGTASADATGDALDAVKKARSGLKTLSAKFTQVRKIGLLKKAVTSKGELTLVMPDKLRWELFDPDGIVYWVTPNGVAYKSSSSNKAASAPAGAFGAVLPDLMAFLAGDLGPLRSRYDMTASTEPDGVKIVATPTNEDVKKALKKLTVKTNSEKWGIAQVAIVEPTGDSSTIDFETNQKNPKVDAEKMKPPK